MASIIIRTPNYHNVNLAVQHKTFETSYHMTQLKVGDTMYVVPMKEQSAIEGVALKARVVAITPDLVPSEVNWVEPYDDATHVYAYRLDNIEVITYEEAMKEANKFHPNGFRGVAYLSHDIKAETSFAKGVERLIKDVTKARTYLVNLKKQVPGTIEPKNASVAISEFVNVVKTYNISSEQDLQNVGITVLKKYVVK